MRRFIKNRISIIIPTFNEEKNINKLLNEILILISNKDHEIFIVDDGSTDKTVENIFNVYSENKNIKVIQREYDRGLLQSIKFALQTITGEFFLVMDGDGQHLPKDIDILLNELKTFDLAVGVRDLKNLNQVSKLRSFFSKFFNKIIKFLLSVKISDPLTGFFAGKTSLLNTKFFSLPNSGFKVLLDLLFCNKNNNINIIQKEIEFKSRHEGVSKLNSQVIFSFITQLLSYLFNGLISSKFIGFCIIGGFGFIIHFSIFLFLLNIIETSFLLSHLFATLCGATINFLANNYLNFFNSRINSPRDLLLSTFKYYLINSPGLVTSLGTANLFYNLFTNNAILASLAGVIVDTIFKYMVSRTWIWKIN
tara:strand:- start:32 stop:1126 length:1095 start_codon:yes stop_codon:yes gene_type:complete